jgi:hypothetical protein
LILAEADEISVVMVSQYKETLDRGQRTQTRTSYFMSVLGAEGRVFYRGEIPFRSVGNDESPSCPESGRHLLSLSFFGWSFEPIIGRDAVLLMFFV